MVLDEFKGITDLTPFRGVFWVKYLENFTTLSLWTQLLLEFSSYVFQTWYVHSPKHKDDPCEKGSRSRVIYGSFWAKHLEDFTILSLWTQLLLEFTSDVHQTWYMYLSKHKDNPCERGSHPGVILG